MIRFSHTLAPVASRCMMSHKILFPLILACLAYNNLASQNYSKIIQLTEGLPTKNEQQQVLVLCEIAWEFRKYNQDSCQDYAELALAKSKDIGFEEGESLALRHIAQAYKYRNHYDTALYLLRHSLAIEQRANRPYRLGSAYLNVGQLEYEQGNSDEALISYHSAVKAFIEADSLEHCAKTYNSIGKVHARAADQYLAFSNYQKGLALRQQIGNSKNVASSWLNLGIHHAQNRNFEMAKKSLLTCRKIYMGHNMKFEVGKIDGSIGNVHFELNELDSALSKYKLSLNSPYGKISPYIRLNIGACFIQLNLLDSALHHLQMGLDISIKQENTYLEELFYTNVGEVYEFREDFQKTLHFYTKRDSVRRRLDSMTTAENIRKIQEKFDNETLKTLNLKAQKETKTLMLMSISLAALLIISLLTIIIFRQRLKTKTQLSLKNEELHLQKLDELAKQKELEKITTLMEGQEQERKRIAGELHDGLGSLLATIKHHFEVVEDKMDTNKDEYAKAYGLLDKASEEVRRISHNMASNVLSKFGLVAALQDLGEVINSSKRLKVNLRVTGLEDRLESSAEIHLFRICQELVSNTLKHANASAVTLQLTMHKDALNLIVEDNGRGFDSRSIEKEEGMGLENLKARVAHLNGTIDLDSVIDRGTTVVIDVPV